MANDNANAHKPARRFTLIELLVAISIIAVLAAILLPALGRAKYQAMMILDINNQKQIAAGTIVYTTDNDEYYPTTSRTDYKQTPYAPIAQNQYNYRDDLIDYFGGTVKKVWTCPLATFNTEGKGSFQDMGSYQNGPRDLDTTSGTFMSYALFFGRTKQDTYDGGKKPYGGGSEIAPEKPMLKAGQPWTHRAYLGTGGSWQYSGNSTFYEFRVLSADGYTRYHHGYWRFAHKRPGGMVHRPSVGGGHDSRGFASGDENSYNTPGIARYDYVYSLDDGSAHALRSLTACDPRHGRAEEWMVPNPLLEN